MLFAFGQFTAMGVAIFGVSSWDVVEPLTYVTSAFWLMIGSKIFLWKNVDMDISAYDQLLEQERVKIWKTANFDEKKEEFLESYLTELKNYRDYLQSTGDEGEAD